MKDGKIKQFILTIWYAFHDQFKLRQLRKKYSLSIMDSEETIAYIKQHCVSIARYGDGELDLMMQNCPENYQEISDGLSESLKDVLRNHSSQLLNCMPYPMISTAHLKKHGKKHWKAWSLNRQATIVTEIRKYSGTDYLFGDSFVSRPFSGYRSTKYSAKLFNLLKELWEGRDILIVEGKKTRLGVGNDLFSGSRSIKRILGPAENAFDRYHEIFDTVTSNWHGELVILALGPTATVLASDLSKHGIQALDLGHIDIQYEWYLAGTSFVPVKGKYTNEALDGRQPENCKDKTYLSQIIAEIK